MQYITNSFLKYKYQLILLVYFIVSLVGICHHELWLDESQHFLLARDSHSISEFAYICRNEGHPYFWVTLLYIITRFTNNPFYMQLLHVLISCLAVWMLCKSNLSFIEKLLIIFGLYFLYEYTIISRNYGLSALMLFLFVYHYLKNKDRIILLSLLLLLFANTHLFSLVISFAIVFTYILYHRDVLLQQSKKNILTAAGIVSVGWAISIYCIVPAGQYGINFLHYDPTPYFSAERILPKLSICLKGLFYLPDYTIANNHFENSVYYSSAHMSHWVFFLLLLLSFFIPAYILKNNRFAFTLFFSFILIFIPVYFFLPLNSTRYYGFFYVLFVACYWIARQNISKTGVRISFLIFGLQFINGVFMYVLDIRYPFSESKNVNAYINGIQKNNERVLILNRDSRLGISIYSGKKYFGVETGDSLSYCLWQAKLPDSILKIKLDKELERNNSTIIISHNTPVNLIDTSRLTLLKTFDQGIIRGENVIVYRYTK